MWNQTGHICPDEQQSKSKNCKQNSSNRKKHNNYTSTLKELAQMLPIPLRTSSKRLTKKEILLRVLRYIEHLQTSIDTARSLLQVRGGEQKEAGRSEQMVPSSLKRRREATPRGKKTKPPRVCKKLRKTKHIRKSERGEVSKKVCKCLALETGKGPSQADMGKEESRSSASSIPSLTQRQCPFFPSFQAPGPGSHWLSSTSFLDIPKSGAPFHKSDWHLESGQEAIKDRGVFSACKAQVAYDELRQYTEGPRHSLTGQELVHYYSSCEEEEGSSASPWLSTQSPMGISHAGNMLLCSPGIGVQSNSCSDLGLSPSLFSSPARLLSKHVLQGGQEELSPVLFEDVYLSPQTFPGTLLRKSAFTLDHCYLSYSEKGKSDSSPMSAVNEITSSWNKQFLQEEASRFRPDRLVSSSDENSDSTWTPCKRVKPLHMSSQNKKKAGRRQKCRLMACEKRSNAAVSSLQLKKKCVNGFIMFCRLNRKHYIRACPGMASTAATRELAQLWRMMTKQERKPYCMKARRFSRLNNRIVRDDFSSEEEDLEPPKPFHLLLAEKSLPGTQNFGDLALLELIP